MNTQVEMNTRLQGRWLVLARLGWVLIALLSSFLFAMGTAAQYHRISIPCIDVPIDEQASCWQTEYALAQLGFTWDDFAAYATATSILGIVPLVLVGWFIFWRKSEDLFSLFFSLGLIAFGSLAINLNLRQDLVSAYPSLNVPAEFVNFLGNLFIGLVPFLFPDGRFVPRWTRWLAILWIGRSLYFFIANAAPHFGNSFVTETLDLAIFPFLAAAIYALVFRYRHYSDLTQRQQIKWVVFGGVIVIPTSGVLFALMRLWEPGFFDLFVFGIFTPIYYLSFLFLIVCLGTSILRYRLWDIDVLIRRTLVYTVLTAMLALVYFGSVVLLQTLFEGLTGQRSPAAIVISTLAIAALFTPLRRRLQDAIDQRFYRRKYDAARALADFSLAARNETDLESLTDQMVDIVEKTMQPERVTLWIAPTNQFEGSFDDIEDA
jgi:hypothetical protein